MYFKTGFVKITKILKFVQRKASDIDKVVK